MTKKKNNSFQFIIISIITFLIVIMFILAIRHFTKLDTNTYSLNASSITYDNENNYISTSNNATLKMGLDGNYKLINIEDMLKVSYNLGTNAIISENNSSNLKLYGIFYEVLANGEINRLSKENKISIIDGSRFFKIADRKYLLVDKKISSSDGSINTKDYLIIEIDRNGNSTIYNDTINVKEINPLVINTTSYDFDIANEYLDINNTVIDLKKIIGSSNTYTKEDLIPEENDNSSSNDGVTNITDNTIGGNGTNGGNDATGDNKGTDDGKNNNSGDVIEEIKKATKRTSVISVTSSVSKIVVDYVVYDPYNEYTNVYMEVEEAGSNKINTIYLNKNDTRYEFTNIFPNTTYRIRFKYSYIEDGNEVIDTFDDITIATKRPKVNIKTTNVSFGKISYLITTDNSYNIESGTLTVKVNNEVVSSNSVSINGNTTDSVSISASSGDMVELILSDIKAGGRIISGVRSSDKFIY